MSEFWPRAIIHVDMDAFFASVEQLDNPAFRGKPVIVGGSAEGRGVVSAASYEARVFGVHSAMPTSKAMRLCPRGIFLPVRMSRYAEVSRQVHEIFTDFTPDVQPISVDEAFLDITGCQRLFGEPIKIARMLKASVREKTGLTASVGIAPNRFVAKIASDLEKPDGLVAIRQDEILDRLAPLPVRRIWGVGRVMAGKLARLGVSTINDLRQWPRHTLQENFGNGGDTLYELARGEDYSSVTPGDPDKSVSNETTFASDVMSVAELRKTLLWLADKVGSRLRAKNMAGRTVQLKLRYDDFSSITRRRTLPSPTCLGKEVFVAAEQLMELKTEAGTRPVRLIGVGVSGFSDREDVQGILFSSVDDAPPSKTEKTERAADQIRKKLGPDAIGRGSIYLDSDID